VKDQIKVSMKYKNIIITIVAITLVAIGYYIGNYNGAQQALKQLSNTEVWNKLPIYIKENIANEAIEYINWKNIKEPTARKILPYILDAAEVPHGDIAVPSEKVHSRRYIVSQWQRSAVGATVILIGTDKDGELCVALGVQRGVLRHPQGYMETALPKEDLTGLRAQNASRINSKTSTLVPIDESIEDNALREIYEEIGLKVDKDQLQLLSINSNMDTSPATVAANYLVRLPDTPTLQTNDDEFVDDDLAKPMWVKISDIKSKDNLYITSLSTLPVDNKTIEILNQALSKLRN
jgi:8-oxo-dGTP pyrophosphatase MutT (NUDIX family)